MKKAEEWNRALDPKMGIEEREMDLERIKQIQLDAMKEGMRRAANIAMRCQRSETVVAQDIQSAAEQLTEKDL